MINIVQFIVKMRNSENLSSSFPCETNGEDQTTPEHVTVASVSLSALLKAKICSWISKNTNWRNFYRYRLIKAWYRHTYFWYQVPRPLQNVVPGTGTIPLVGTTVPLSAEHKEKKVNKSSPNPCKSANRKFVYTIWFVLYSTFIWT